MIALDEKGYCSECMAQVRWAQLQTYVFRDGRGPFIAIVDRHVPYRELLKVPTSSVNVRYIDSHHGYFYRLAKRIQAPEATQNRIDWDEECEQLKQLCDTCTTIRQVKCEMVDLLSPGKKYGVAKHLQRIVLARIHTLSQQKRERRLARNMLKQECAPQQDQKTIADLPISFISRLFPL